MSSMTLDTMKPLHKSSLIGQSGAGTELGGSNGKTKRVIHAKYQVIITHVEVITLRCTWNAL
uniref:AlNc14C18G1847 protein n=1 Tax=Albugo laibachii Nc14 TaxID=890382 RepID=F0W4M6_9STRA|nr:AlNc14C18G1847 [Albugo laibachii Nc14]|eukprot:CCA16060.1 AlNc14C18G1847 [Albugo laibachii Nc14]